MASRISDKLTEWFMKFPGIGPRQARRFVHFLLTQSPAALAEFVELVKRLPNEVSQCPLCYRFAPVGRDAVCDLCRLGVRDDTTLMVVARDVDLDAVEKSRVYTGRYFVLGGTLSPLDRDPEKKVRLAELRHRIDQLQKNMTELIVALGAHAEGDYTTAVIRDAFTQSKFRISILGRGLSTGTELEYSDFDTIQNALKNRISQ